MNQPTMPQHQPGPPTGPGYGPPVKPVLGRVPVVFWVAIGLGVIGFALKVSYMQEQSGPDGYSCTYSNYAGYLVAAAIVVLTIVGVIRNATSRAMTRLPGAVLVLFATVALALAVVHALRGSGTIMTECPG